MPSHAVLIMTERFEHDAGGGDALLLHVIDGESVIDGDLGAWAKVARFLRAPFASAYRHRDLIRVILKRELDERFKGSQAGWIWALTAPLLSLLIYTFAFGGSAVLPNKTAARTTYDYSLFVFGGLIAFNFFAEMAYRAPSLLQEYAHFIKQTLFPAEMLAVISTLRASAYAGIGVVLMLVAQLAFTHTLSWTVLLLPVWVIAFMAFLIGMTWFLSALGAFTRDVSYLMMTISPLLLFATPVFFSQEVLPHPMNLVIYANVLTGFVEIVRDLVFFGQLPGAAVTAWTLLVSVGMFWFGYWFFNRNRANIADVL
jgi:lipopolysaccharide transport system permease protein